MGVVVVVVEGVEPEDPVEPEEPVEDGDVVVVVLGDDVEQV